LTSLRTFAAMKRPVILSDRAANAVKRIVARTQETSLIGAEEVREVIINRLKGLASNPETGSRKAKFDRLDGDYRSIVVWDYRIYYKIEEKRIVVLDFMLEKK
jgi:plasmid stabilization system protein ParE